MAVHTDDFKKVIEMIPLYSQLTRTNSLKAWARSGSIVLLLLVLLAQRSPAQTNCGAGTSSPSTSLSCLAAVSLTPAGFSPASPAQPAASTTFSPNTLSFLSGAIGAEVSQIPLASPASGIIYTNNPVTQLPERLDQSFGPILTQRAQTIGRHNFYVAVTYQYFLLEDIDSQALKNLPAVIYLNSASNPTSAVADFAGVSNNYFQLKVHQFVGYFTYGLTSRVDVSVAVPILQVDLRDTFSELFVHNPQSICTSGCPATPGNISGSNAGEATGVGDVVIAAKVNVWKLRRNDRDHGGLSAGVEFRVPSGDAKNFLGSGAFGAKPFATFSYAGHFSPHVNVAYQFNGDTDLITKVNATTGALTDGQLPNRLIYSGGMDFSVFKKLTVNVDAIAQHVFDVQRATLLPAGTLLFSSGSNVTTGTPVVQPVTGSYTQVDASGGIKWNPFKAFLISGNISVKLNQAGLRARLVPLVGASYTF
jgi:Putative MetA-pathway of phenol degradation